MDKTQKRNITNEEFICAYYGGSSEESKKAAEDNRNIIHSITRGYPKLSRDDKHSCGLVALMRALQSHDDSFNQKFTSTLYRFVHWECKKAMAQTFPRSSKNHEDKYYLSGLLRHFDCGDTTNICDEDSIELMNHIKQCHNQMYDKQHKRLIQQHYFDGKTIAEIGEYHNYTREAARVNLIKATQVLYEVVRASIGLPIYKLDIKIEDS